MVEGNEARSTRRKPYAPFSGTSPGELVPSVDEDEISARNGRDIEEKHLRPTSRGEAR
jgi:hypothetical protein